MRVGDPCTCFHGKLTRAKFVAGLLPLLWHQAAGARCCVIVWHTVLQGPVLITKGMSCCLLLLHGRLTTVKLQAIGSRLIVTTVQPLIVTSKHGMCLQVALLWQIMQAVVGGMHCHVAVGNACVEHTSHTGHLLGVGGKPKQLPYVRVILLLPGRSIPSNLISV